MADRRKVLLMIDSFEMGGAEGQALLLASRLLKCGRYKPLLACLKRSGPLLEEAEALGLGEIPEFPLTSFYDRNMLTQERRFMACVRDLGIDVVHPQSFYTNVFGITGAALAGVPVRIAFRGETAGWRTPGQNFVERCVFRLATAVHANSEAVRKYLIENGVSGKKIFTVYNGLDGARVMPQPGIQREELLARFGLPVDGNRRFVAIVANMRHDVKNHPMFLRAAARVHKELPNAAFILVGEGDLTESLRSLATDLGIAAVTFFTGRCDTIADLLSITDVCVLSSKAEGFSNSILEYMAAGVPVVATDVGGAREAVVAGETGYLVKSDDDEAMAARIISLLRDPERSRAMGLRGREVVEEKFSDRAQLENTEALYDRLLARTRRQRSQKFKGITAKARK